MVECRGGGGNIKKDAHKAIFRKSTDKNNKYKDIKNKAMREKAEDGLSECECRIKN